MQIRLMYVFLQVTLGPPNDEKQRVSREIHRIAARSDEHSDNILN